jgi:hypothetical protein
MVQDTAQKLSLAFAWSPMEPKARRICAVTPLLELRVLEDPFASGLEELLFPSLGIGFLVFWGVAALLHVTEALAVLFCLLIGT